MGGPSQYLYQVNVLLYFSVKNHIIYVILICQVTTPIEEFRFTN